MTDSLAWYVARSSGLVAWALLASGVFLGLALSTRVMGTRPRPKWLLDLHRFVGGLALVFVAVHVAGLMMDHYVHFGIQEVLLPLASSYRPLPVAAGIVGLYLLVAIELTSLAMHRIPKRWWRTVHSTSFVLFVLTSVHVVSGGTDASKTPVKVLALVLSAGFVFLVTYRWLAPRRAVPQSSRGANMPTMDVPAEIERVA